MDDPRKGARAALQDPSDAEALERGRVEWLGRQDGRVTMLLRSVRDQPQEQRAAFGAAANALKQALETALRERQEELRRAELEALATKAALDVSLPGRPQEIGRLHPVTQTLRDCIRAFEEMGFRVAEGPEVEWER